MSPVDRDIEDKWVVNGDDVYNKKMYAEEEALIKGGVKMDALPPTQRLKIRVSRYTVGIGIMDFFNSQKRVFFKELAKPLIFPLAPFKTILRLVMAPILKPKPEAP